jgi:hypothetical protein
MHRFSAFILLVSMVLSSTEMHEVLRLPLLWDHFTLHQNLNTDLTMWEFLEEHYTHSESQDSNHTQDHNLPFKMHDCASVLKFPEQPKPLDCLSPLYLPEYKQVSPAVVLNFPSGYTGSIWQPPQLNLG